MVIQYKKLYWCETYGIVHRRLIIAYSKIEAKRFFSKRYGSYLSSIEADKICRLPKIYQEHIVSFQCGPIECGILNYFPIKFLKDCKAEIVDKNDKRFLIAKRMFRNSDKGLMFCFYIKNKKLHQMYQEII